MFLRYIASLSVTALLVSPTLAQFGVAGNRKKPGSSFQELNEMAKQGAGGAAAGADDDPADIDSLMKGLGMDPAEMKKMMGKIDPKMLEELAGLGPQMDEMMKMMAEMDPEELQQQMKYAMDMISSNDMMAGMVENQELILKQLEESGVVDAGELAKFKADPEYFEQKMKMGFDQVKEMFSDPEILKAATATVKATTEMYKNPELMQQTLGSMMAGFEVSDEQIEEIRQLLLKDPDGNPMLHALVGGDSKNAKEMDEMLNDPKKWRESVRKGLDELKTAGAGGVGTGAGMGEL